jgi:hypothetical protein
MTDSEGSNLPQQQAAACGCGIRVDTVPIPGCRYVPDIGADELRAHDPLRSTVDNKERALHTETPSRCSREAS